MADPSPGHIRFLGHAGLDIHLGGTRVLCDPWLSPRGAFVANWHQFPSTVGVIDPASLRGASWVYVSHIHPDHFDAETLATLPRDVRVLIARFPSRELREGIDALGFREVVEAAPGQWVRLGDGVEAQVLIDPAGYIEDSCLVLRGPQGTIVDQNDCALDGPGLDLLAALRPLIHFVQFSGASYFPAVYDFPPERMRLHVQRYRELLMSRFLEATRRVGAPHVVPFAGPPCFLEDRNFHLNFDGIYFDHGELAAMVGARAPEVAARLRPLQPGSTVTGLGTDALSFPADPPPYASKAAYLEAYRRRRAPLIAAYVEELRASAPPLDGPALADYLRVFFGVPELLGDMALVFELRLRGGPSAWVDFRTRPVRILSEPPGPSHYRIECDAFWVAWIVAGRLTWYDLMQSGRATLHRDPDVYSVGLMNHLNFRHRPELVEVLRRLAAERSTVRVQDDEMEYTVQRLCPHLGRDLSQGTVRDGILTCAAHGWQFDLRDGGRCVFGGGVPIVVTDAVPRPPR
jgi:UDP-MurNAc hydroxylase